MKLHSFSVTNYRSITNAHKITIADNTILVGANNEGKSNIIRALDLAMKILLNYERLRVQARLQRYQSLRSLSQAEYNFSRDFPVQLQSRMRSLESIFRLEFELGQQEIKEFRTEIGQNLGGILKIEIKIGANSLPRVRTVLQGKGGKALKEKTSEVCKFISERILFNHIPAVRTHEHVISIIREAVSSELKSLKDDPGYRDAIQKIRDLRRPIIASIEERIAKQLDPFLPNLNGISLELKDEIGRGDTTHNLEIIIDDGNPTTLETKGDGIKSLAALALLKDRYSRANGSVIAIEEPESHLHPAAIHQIRDIIYDLAKDNQVIVSTHNPTFVNRIHIHSNIIIRDGKATPAKNVSEVREVLGVRVNDNLHNSQIAIVVEGECDEKILGAILPSLNPKYFGLFEQGVIGFHKMDGASKLSYHLLNLRNSVCESIVFLDNDDASSKALDDAIIKRYIQVKNTFLSRCDGYAESEIEDCIVHDLYFSGVREKFGIDLNDSPFKSNKKWSVRVGDTAKKQSKPWNQSIEKDIKVFVTDLVVTNPASALDTIKGTSIAKLAERLTELIG